MNSDKQKTVRVYSKGAFLDFTTPKRARRLVEKRKEAVWLTDDSILLIGGRNERKKIKENLLEKNGRVCYICGEIIPEDEDPTLDHIVPKSRFGPDMKENCAICCHSCNKEKGGLDIREFVQKLVETPRSSRSLSYISDQRLSYLENRYLNKKN